MRKVYLIHETNGIYRLCKVLNDYTNLDEAKNDLVSIATNTIDEADLLKKFSEKEF